MGSRRHIRHECKCLGRRNKRAVSLLLGPSILRGRSGRGSRHRSHSRRGSGTCCLTPVVTILCVTQIRPSKVYLPKFDNAPATILEYLLARYSQVNETIWRDRVSRGKITLSDGRVMEEHTPYVHGITVFYRREVLSEPEPVEEPQIIY